MIFQDKTHTYTVDGKVIPSVTQVIYEVIESKTFYSGSGLVLGSAVHKACQYHDEGCLDESTIGAVREHLNSYRQFLKDFEVEWTGIEEQFYDQEYKFAGRRDRRGLVNQIKMIVDIKTNSFTRGAAIQLAAYGHEYPGYLQRILLLTKNGYKLIDKVEKNYDIGDPIYWELFASGLKIYRWRKS